MNGRHSTDADSTGLCAADDHSMNAAILVAAVQLESGLKYLVRIDELPVSDPMGLQRAVIRQLWAGPAIFRNHAMRRRIRSSSYWSLLIHWSARLTSLLLLALVLVIVVGHGGLPNIPEQPARVQLEFAAMGIMLLGLVIGWVREGLGGVLVLAGLAGLNTVELVVNGRPALGAFPLFAVPGALFLLSALLWRIGKQLPAKQ
jgi:hypothetical protein